MSGIAGLIHFDGKPVEPGLIEKMTSAMAHRGPDGLNHWVKGSVALGQCMLRTTPESLEEQQPLTNEDESLVLVMDGRVDNWEELRRELLARGAVLRNRSDAELVLRAYEVWGEDCPDHLLGDFAFAVWEGKHNRLYCARDHFGVKPFYYFSDGEYLAFASDEEAFLPIPGVSMKVNEDFIAANLFYQFDGGDLNRGWLADILKLPPATSLMVGGSGGKALRTYWELQPSDESRFASDQECEEAFRSVFREAVRCRMRIQGHPALMLSGGIDSASIAGMAREILPSMPQQELHTFSVVSDHAESCGETRNIRSIIAGHERQAHLVSVPSFQGSITDDDLKEAAWTHAHPVGNSILLPAMMYLSAQRSGHRVMYDGIDGDLVTYTPERYMGVLLRAGEWRQAWRESRQAAVNNTYLQHLSPLTIFAKSAWDVYVPGSVQWLKRRIWNIRSTNPLRNSLINLDFAASIRLAERLTEQQSLARKLSQRSDQERHIHVLTQMGIPWAMEGFDAVAARYGIEPRHPWSDKRLVEFYVRLPARQKARDGWTKYLLRKAMASSLDAGVRWHTGKDHLGMYLVRRLMQESRGQIQGVLRTFKRTLGDYVDMGLFDALLGRPDRGAEDQDLAQLFTVVTLALWLGRLRMTS